MKAFVTSKPSNNTSTRTGFKVHRNPIPEVKSFSPFSISDTVIQRKPNCSCGGGCPRCKEILPIQPKLKIGEPGDKYEQEADRIADQIMRMSDDEVPGISHVSANIQRKCSDCASGEDLCPECVDEGEGLIQRNVGNADPSNMLRTGNVVNNTNASDEFLHSLGPGHPLDPSTRAFFEPRFGYDFSKVRVHTDEEAGESAHQGNALAYTVGQDVVFGSGQYERGTSVGRELLAHELTHVLQQQASVPLDANRQQEPGGPRMAPSLLGTNERTLQRAYCPGERRRADDDETAKQAVANIKRAQNELLRVLNDPGVDENVKWEMVEAIDRSLVAVKAYMKVIEGQCGGGGVSPMMAQAGTMNPAAAAVAFFAALLVSEAARRLSTPEQQAVDKLAVEMEALATGAKKLTEKVEITAEEPLPPPVEVGPIEEPIPPLEPALEPKGRTRRKSPRRACLAPGKSSVSLPTKPLRARLVRWTPGGSNFYRFIDTDFPMELKFLNDPQKGCDCSCGEYLQMLKGFSRRGYGTGAMYDEEVKLIGGSLNRNKYLEDAREGNPDLPYGHRTSLRGNTDEDSFLPIRATGCAYKGSDEPHMLGKTPGERLHFRFEFQGTPVDGCNGRIPISEWRYWVVEGKDTVP